MDDPATPDARAFLEDLLRTGLVLSELAGDLLDALPDEVDGEPASSVLVDMMAGSAEPAIAAAGAAAVAEAQALMAAVVDRILDDLREAARLAASRERRAS
jgi:hypothetical protein